MEHKDFKNIHSGERVFIIGNGPSLNDTPMHMLKNEYTISLNSISLIFKDTDWKPSYYVNVKSSTPSENKVKNYLQTVQMGIPCFFAEHYKSYLPQKENVIYLESININDDCLRTENTEDLINQAWSHDIKKRVYRPASSIYSAAQIASYMGFDEFIFIGCDGYEEQHPIPQFTKGNDPWEYAGSSYIDFLTENGSPLKSLINGMIYKFSKSRFTKAYTLLLGGDKNHFDKTYKISNRSKTWAKDFNDRLVLNHNAIEKIGRHVGFDTYNATISKNIDIHESVKFEELFE